MIRLSTDKTAEILKMKDLREEDVLYACLVRCNSKELDDIWDGLMVRMKGERELRLRNMDVEENYE